MEEAKHYLIYFEPPLSISTRIQKLYKIISSKHKNSYNSLVNGIWRSHLMVYLSSMPEENETKILTVVKKIAENLKPFKVKLSDFEKEDSGYIFVGIEKNYHKQLKSIREKLIDELLPYRDSSIKKKYLDKWDSFSNPEKQRIKKTGLPYKYKPHLTVARVLPEETKSAIKLIEDKSLKSTHFTVNTIQVLVFYKGINKIIGKYSFN